MNIQFVWEKINEHEGETFYTIRGKEFGYVIYDDYMLINDMKSRKITKNMITKAMHLKNPTPQKLSMLGFRGPSYIYGIITDDRIKDY